MAIIKFCPKCRRPIRMPIVGIENVSVLGNITVECGHKTKFSGKEVRCTGKIIIKAKKDGSKVLG